MTYFLETARYEKYQIHVEGKIKEHLNLMLEHLYLNQPLEKQDDGLETFFNILYIIYLNQSSLKTKLLEALDVRYQEEVNKMEEQYKIVNEISKYPVFENAKEELSKYKAVANSIEELYKTINETSTSELTEDIRIIVKEEYPDFEKSEDEINFIKKLSNSFLFQTIKMLEEKYDMIPNESIKLDLESPNKEDISSGSDSEQIDKTSSGSRTETTLPDSDEDSNKSTTSRKSLDFKFTSEQLLKDQLKDHLKKQELELEEHLKGQEQLFKEQEQASREQENIISEERKERKKIKLDEEAVLDQMHIQYKEIDGRRNIDINRELEITKIKVRHLEELLAKPGNNPQHPSFNSKTENKTHQK